MLLGQYIHSIDSKNRIILPSKYRSEIGDSFVLTKGLDKCLLLYSKDEFSDISLKISSLPIGKKEVRAFTRHFFAQASECEIDKNGRFVINEELKTYSGLDKEAVFIGLSNRLEIWSTKEWESYNSEFDFSSLSEELTNLTF